MMDKAQDALDEKAVEAVARKICWFEERDPDSLVETTHARKNYEYPAWQDYIVDAKDFISAYESAKPALPAPDCEGLIAEARRLAELWDGNPQMIVGYKKICDLATALESLSCQLNEAEAKVAELERENFRLAAITCDAPRVSEYGHMVCDWKSRADRLAAEVVTLEKLRPIWAQGYSFDSIAAQANAAALAEIWSVLGVTNQTDAMHRLTARAELTALSPSTEGE